MPGVSLASLETMTSAQPRRHPWALEAGTWLPAGLSYASELSAETDPQSVSRLLALCAAGRRNVRLCPDFADRVGPKTEFVVVVCV